MSDRPEKRRRQRKLEKVTRKELNTMKKLCGRNEKTEAVEWALNLKPKEQKHLNLMMTENSKNDVNVYLEAYTMSLRINLNDNEELINKINDDVSEEGYKVKEYRDNGGNYIMALKNNKEAIIKDYEKGIASNIKESEVIKDLAVNYKATVNAIKLIIKDYKKSKVKECKSNTCPFQKNNKCTNEVILAGKDECYQFNANDNIKIIKDGTTTKKDKIFKFIKEHEDLAKDKLYDEIQRTFNVTRDSVRKYYSLYIKDNPRNEDVAKNTTTEKIDNKPVEINKKSKYKIIKEVIQRDIEGECGVYHIEIGQMRVEDVIYTNKDDINKQFKEIEEDIEKEYQEAIQKAQELKINRINNATKVRNEALDIMEEFM